MVTLRNQHNSWPERSVNQPTSFQAPFEAKKGERLPPRSLKVENEDLEAFEPQSMTDERWHDTLVAPRQTRRRVFRQAQEKTSTLLPAPSVSVESHTTSEPAKQKHDGMESLLYTAEIRTIASSTARGSSFAQTGSDQRDVLENTVTNVPDVAVEVMEPTIAHSRNLEITTPLRPDGWVRLLRTHNLLVKYPHIPQYIRHGANAGIPEITKTYTPPNCSSIIVHNSAFNEIIAREFHTLGTRSQIPSRYIEKTWCSQTQSNHNVPTN